MTKLTTKSIKEICYIVLFIIITFLVIHFSQTWFANEYVIKNATINISGKQLKIIFSEKTNTLNDNTQHQKVTGKNNNHLGYFLELYDSVAKYQHDKIKFNSPVKQIQSKPQMFVLANKIIWLVSVSNDLVYDKPGFILKFEIKNNKIIQSEFVLDSKYKIRNIYENKVIITEGNSISGINFDPIFGCTYFDLEKEKVCVLKPLTSTTN